MKKILLITSLAFILILLFVLNLYKNVVATGEKPFSIQNIIIVSVFFIIFVPLVLLVQNLFTLYKEKKAAGKIEKDKDSNA